VGHYPSTTNKRGIIRGGDIMTWSQIKEAVEEAGVEDNEEIRLIECENGDGDGTFHKMRLGKAIKLTENTVDNPEDFSGCAV
jgi:hypothetical protein